MGPRNHGREIAFLVSGALRPINGWNTVIGGSVRSADDRHFQWALADGSGFEERNVLAHAPPAAESRDTVPERPLRTAWGRQR
jgi:hypothetical protein